MNLHMIDRTVSKRMTHVCACGRTDSRRVDAPNMITCEMRSVELLLDEGWEMVPRARGDESCTWLCDDCVRRISDDTRLDSDDSSHRLL